MENEKILDEKKLEDIQKKLLALNVNDHVEIKPGKVELKYLSWSWAWNEILKIYPTATYEIKNFADKDGVSHCYQFDENLGYMVFTSITIEGLTKEMWLPVMDSNNKAMKNVAYKYQTKFGEKSVEPATMFDINKTIMRCLVKNLAMFGLGLYIYSGEDLPFEADEPATKEQIEKIYNLNVNIENVCKRFKIQSIEKLTYSQAEFVIVTKEKQLEKDVEV